MLATLNKGGAEYSLVTYSQLVGVCLYVFVRSCHAPLVSEVRVDQVKTGLGGAAGNKGTVAISLTLAASSLCFLCSHFAAGQSQVAERNSDYSEAVKRISFSNVGPNIVSLLHAHHLSPYTLLLQGRTVLSHDYVFWCGDFNYRINMERDEVIDMVNKKVTSNHIVDFLFKYFLK